MFYKMFMYGRPLDWSRIAGLRESEHGRWLPDGPLGRKSLFTDFCWQPRANEVHFTCEEVPVLAVSPEASRYLHAIYLPERESFEHFDGALRVYTVEELSRRHDLHVRNAGKLGYRQKVFRADEAIPQEAFSAVTQAFFVWNYDIQTYLAETLVSSS